jgi:DNA-directed RNA polymerase specialized sigma24 family protein
MTTQHLLDFALQLTGNPDESALVVAEAQESCKQIKPVDPACFLLVTVRNKCYDYLRLSIDPA